MTRSSVPSNQARGIASLIQALFAILLAIVALGTIYYFFAIRTPNEALNEIPDYRLEQVEPLTRINIQAATVVFRESFSEDQDRWELSPAGQAQYLQDALVLDDSIYEGIAWARPHLEFSDFVLEIQSRWLGGAVGGDYGVQFRYVDEGNYFALYLHNDGRYQLIRTINGQRQVLVDEFTPLIQRSGGVNTIRIEAIEDRFRFFINDGYLTDLVSGGLPEGDVRLIAQNVAGMDTFMVGFDNLTIARHPAVE